MSGNLGGLFDSGVVPYNPKGGMRTIKIASGQGLRYCKVLMGWGDYTYLIRTSTGSGGQIRYDHRTDTIEDVPNYSRYINIGGMCNVNNDQDGRVHYLAQQYGDSNVVMSLDLETMTLSSASYSTYISKANLVLQYGNYFYSVTGSGNNINVTKMDKATGVVTNIKLNVTLPSIAKIVSFTVAGDGLFYLTGAYWTSDSIYNDPDTTVSIIEWNETTGETKLLKTGISVEIRNRSLDPPSYFYYNLHYPALYSIYSSGRVYMMLACRRGSSTTPMWAILNIKLGTFEIVGIEQENMSYSMTRTGDKTMVSIGDRYGFPELREWCYQED